MSRVVSELFVKMAAGVTLQRCSVRRLRLIWIFLGCFSCLYWASGITDNGNNFFDGGDNSTANDTSLNCPNVTSENCSQLPAQCLYCGFNDDNFTCVYGLNVTVECSPLPGIYCEGSARFNKTLNCTYCFLTDPSMYECTSGQQATCMPFVTEVEISRSTYRAQCAMSPSVLCLGNRTFEKNIICNRVSDLQWGTAWALSITLGGFGLDRFYLGHWQSGLGKLFTFGGLGIWSIFDIIIVGVGYLTPADGSQFPY